MSDKIRIVSIELENYRQYHGKHKIDFSSREEGFTIIAGKNGEGKSNLLNSISWCLYRKEPHGMKESVGYGSENRSLPIINNRYITELGEEKVGRTSVEIWIEKGDTIYSISRVLTVTKHKLEFRELDGGDKKVLLIAEHADDRVPQGCEIIPEQSRFVIKKKGPNEIDFHDTQHDVSPEVLMDEILPHGLSKYFLLDGEFLEGFWKDATTIRNGIEQISQLHLLSALEAHVDSVSTPPKGMGKDIDGLTTRINLIMWNEKSLDENGNEKFSQEQRWSSDPNEEGSYYHASGKPLMQELEKDVEKMKEKSTSISQRIGTGNIHNLKKLQEEKIEIESDIAGKEKEVESLKNKWRYKLITQSPYVFLKRAIEESVSITEARMSAGDLPIRQRRQFAEDLLNRRTCICGESLDADAGNQGIDKRITSIKNFKDNIQGKDDLDAAVDMRYDFRHNFIDKYDGFLKDEFGSPREEFERSDEELDDLKYRLQQINTEFKDKGDDDINALIDEQIHLMQEIESKIKRSKDIDVELKHQSKDLSDLRRQLEKALKSNKKIKKLAHQHEIWNRVKNHIHQAYDELKNEIRNDVQDATWKNFKELLSNPTEFKSFTIDSDYSVYMLDEHNTNKIYNLSAGQSLILTLAFVATLREPTGYKFPLVVDSPLGKIDGGNRYNIGTRLPEYLPEEQLSLLVTDTEYAAPLPLDPEHPDMPQTPVAKLLEEKIRLKHFKIKKETAGPNKGNSQILPARLEFDQDRQSWVVNVDV